MIRKSILILSLLAIIVAMLSPEAGRAIPAFARKYGFSCSTCHIIAPKLKDYGDEFAGNAFQLPDEDEPPRAFQDVGDDRLLLQRNYPVAVRFDAYARYRTEGDINNDLQFPYGVKLLSGGNIAKDIGYYFYFYMNERGEVAGLEDAYVHFNNIGGSEFDLMVGQFQISDPLFKRELRLTFEDYQIYKTNLGKSKANLTYDRGIIVTYSLPTKTDFILEIINGNGIHEAVNRMFDQDSFKNVFFKVSQEIPFGSLGVFGYMGQERNAFGENLIDPDNGTIYDVTDEENKFIMFGPDIVVGTEMVELNAQYLRRTDNNPEFRTGFDSDVVTDGFIGEVVINPNPEKSHLFGALLYNKVTSDFAGIEYETVTAHLSYLFKTNLRLLAEISYDTENKETLVTAGYMAGF